MLLFKIPRSDSSAPIGEVTMNNTKTGTTVPSINTTPNTAEQDCGQQDSARGATLTEHIKEKLRQRPHPIIKKVSPVTKMALPQDGEEAIEAIFEDYGNHVLGIVYDAVQNLWSETDSGQWSEHSSGLNEAQRCRVIEEIKAAIWSANEGLTWTVETAFIDARDEVLDAFTILPEATSHVQESSEGLWFKHALDDVTSLFVSAKMIPTDPSAATNYIDITREFGDDFVGFDGTLVIEARDAAYLNRGTIARANIVWEGDGTKVTHLEVTEGHQGKGIMNCLLALGWQLTTVPVFIDLDWDVVDAL